MQPTTNTYKTFSGAHTIGCNMDNNTMISFSNFEDDGNVKTHEGQEYIVTEDIDTDKKYKDSKAQFHSLYSHWSHNGAYIDMKEFLRNEKQLIIKEKTKKESKTPSLFLHDLPLNGECIRAFFEHIIRIGMSLIKYEIFSFIKVKICKLF